VLASGVTNRGYREIFERLTEKAIKVVLLSQEESRALQSGYVGTGHLLLGILSERTSLAFKALTDAGVSLEVARAEVEGIIGHGDDKGKGTEIPFSEDARMAFQVSMEMTRSLGVDYINPDSMLLAFIRNTKCRASQVLNKLHFNVDAFFVKMVAHLGEPRKEKKITSERADRGDRAKRTISNVDNATSRWTDETEEMVLPVISDVIASVRKPSPTGATINPHESGFFAWHHESLEMSNAMFRQKIIDALEPLEGLLSNKLAVNNSCLICESQLSSMEKIIADTSNLRARYPA